MTVSARVIVTDAIVSSVQVPCLMVNNYALGQMRQRMARGSDMGWSEVSCELSFEDHEQHEMDSSESLRDVLGNFAGECCMATDGAAAGMAAAGDYHGPAMGVSSAPGGGHQDPAMGILQVGPRTRCLLTLGIKSQGSGVQSQCREHAVMGGEG